MLQSGDAASDREVQRTLEDRGHTVTIGPNGLDFTGKQVSLSAFDVTVLLVPANLDGGSYPPDGSAALASYLYSGGRLITAEPFGRSLSNSSALRLLLPVQRHTNSNTPGSTTFSRSEPDPLLDNGVSESFSLNLKLFGYFEPFPTAKVYFTTRLGSPGLLGRTLAGGGRILSFATPASSLELQNPDFRRLFGNAIDWATAPVPPPVKTTDPARILLLGSGTPDWDREIQRALQERGHTVTAGPLAVDFTGRQANLAAFDVTLIVPGQENFGAPVFQTDGVNALRDYLTAGGRVVTAEPFNRGISNSSPFRSFLPVQRLANSNQPGRITFAQSDPDPVIDEGVAASFLFDVSSQGYFETTPDSKTFFISRVTGSAGLVGRTLAGGGRVLSFAVPIGALELQDPNFRQLLWNAIAWAKPRTAAPPQFSVSPDSLAFSSTAGGANPPAQTLAVSASPASAYSITVTPAASWLSVSPLSGTTPSTLTVTVNAAALAAGSYSGEVAILGGAVPLRVPVKLTVNSAGSNSCTYQISPLSQNFSLSGGDGTIGVVTQSGCSWTAVSNDSFVTVTAGASGSGSGGVAFRVAANSAAQSRSGTLVVAGMAFIVNQSGSTLSYLVGPSPLAFRFTQGATTGAERILSLIPSGSGAAFTAAATGGAWLSVTPSAGTLPGTVLASVNPSGLASGVYKGSIAIRVPGASPSEQSVPVEVTIEPAGPPQLSVEPSTVNLTATRGGQPVTAKLQVRNQGSGTLVFRATSSGGSWLSVQPDSGTATLALPATLVITGNPQTLEAGTYTGRIRIAPDGGTPVDVDVFMTVSAGRQTMLVSQSGLTFTAVAQGGAVLPQNFGVLNTGEGLMEFSVAASTFAGGSWLSVSPTRGVADAASLDVPLIDVNVSAAGLAPGEYHGLMTISSSTAANSPQLVSVLLRVLPAGSDPGPIVRPTGLIFTANAASPGSSTQEVLVSNPSATPRSFNSDRLTFDGAPWFSHLPLQATVQPNQPTRLLVQFNPAGLSPGPRTGALTLLFADGAVQTVSILSVVAPAPSLSPLSLGAKGQSAAASTCGSPGLQIQTTTLRRDFVAVVGQASTLGVKVVDECGRPIDKVGLVTSRFSNNDPTINLASIGGGNWTATWRPVNRADSVSIEITAYTVDGAVRRGGQVVLTGIVQDTSQVPLVKPGSVLHAASFLGGVPLAPGSLISLYGSNLSEGTGIADRVPLPMELNHVQVLLGNRSLPLLYASSGQVNAQIPYDLPVNTQHQIAVRRGDAISVPDTLSVAAAQPGIFTALQTGTGQGSIYKSDLTTLVDAASPAKPGDTVVIYCTGLGRVDPPVTEGSPAPTAPLAETVDPVIVRIGGVPATVSFHGLTPQAVGLYQVNVVVPAVSPGDAVPVQIEVANQVSATVTMAIR